MLDFEEDAEALCDELRERDFAVPRDPLRDEELWDDEHRPARCERLLVMDFAFTLLGRFTDCLPMLIFSCDAAADSTAPHKRRIYASC